LLPLVVDFAPLAPIPPGNTEDSIREGARWCLAGGVERLVRLLVERWAEYDRVEPLLTGGDAAVLRACLPAGVLCPTLTLEGIRIAAEAQP
jgi:pantothenate kinase type III